MSFFDPPSHIDDYTAGFEVAYRLYLKSPNWKKVRGIVLERDGGSCSICGEPAKVIHHDTYKHLFDEENHLEDLRSLCNHCHRDIHHKLRGKS